MCTRAFLSLLRIEYGSTHSTSKVRTVLQSFGWTVSGLGRAFKVGVTNGFFFLGLDLAISCAG